MSPTTWLLVLAVALLVWLTTPSPLRLDRPERRGVPESAAPQRSDRKVLRGVVALSAGVGAWVVVGGALGVVAGLVVPWVAWRILAAAEPATTRREREAAAVELPHLVDLFASTLRSGMAPTPGLAAVCAALPGPAAERLRPVLAHADLGGSLDQAWEMVADDDVLAPLGRALVRSRRTGASVVDTVSALADELELDAAASAEDRARRVGVLAAIPLGLCLLPAFLLLGIVPSVAAMLSTVVP